jgi:hypothetical protein
MRCHAFSSSPQTRLFPNSCGFWVGGEEVCKGMHERVNSGEGGGDGIY